MNIGLKTKKGLNPIDPSLNKIEFEYFLLSGIYQGSLRSTRKDRC